jgi:glycosyltransferase involved in cell wall biosynthesis
MSRRKCKTVAILSSADCIHTLRWCNGLALQGLKIILISQQQPLEGYSSEIDIKILPHKGQAGYLLNVFALRKLYNSLSFDVFHIHYASGYGTLANLAGIKNYILSVWGSDVYDFPRKSYVHHALVQRSISNAILTCSTSITMKQHVVKNFKLQSPIEVVYFGVDTFNFKPILENKLSAQEREKFVIGTVKTLRPKYGIDILIKAFAKLYHKYGAELELVIAGKGEQHAYLSALAKELGVEHAVKFVGWVANEEVPNLLNTFDLYTAPSTLDSESFGVAIIEASSCGLPVVVSDVGGLPEVVINNKTGIVVKRNSESHLFNALEKLYLDLGLSNELGNNGRTHVVNTYDWNKCLKLMVSKYDDCIALLEEVK